LLINLIEMTARKMRAPLALALLTLSVAAQAPAIALRTTAGGTVNLSQPQGKVRVLAFSATWSPLVDRELPALQQLASSYAGRDVEFYWVSINSAKQGAKNYASDADLDAFARRSGLQLPVLRDSEQAAYRGFGVSNVPTLVVIDREGRVAFKHIGIDPDRAESLDDVRRAVDRLLS
jgi:peroxiredoxin